YILACYVFFFQAEDGIRDRNVTGVQTCALPISLLLVRRFYRASGLTLAAALGVRRGQVGRDLLWGLLWLLVLNVPFGAAVAGTVFAMYGADAPAAFETVFYDSSLERYQDPALLLVIGLISVSWGEHTPEIQSC